MTLGEVIKEYRELHGISQREFAKMAGLSNSYISQLEQNMNTKNGLPILPSLATVKQVADAMNRSFDEVFNLVSDQVVSFSTNDAPDVLSEKIMRIVVLLPEHLKMSLLDLLQSMYNTEGN